MTTAPWFPSLPVTPKGSFSIFKIAEYEKGLDRKRKIYLSALKEGKEALNYIFYIKKEVLLWWWTNIFWSAGAISHK